MLFFRNGQMKYRYEGDTKRAAMVEFMRFPRPHHKPAPKDAPEEKSWSTTDSDIAHLTCRLIHYTTYNTIIYYMQFENNGATTPMVDYVLVFDYFFENRKNLGF